VREVRDVSGLLLRGHGREIIRRGYQHKRLADSLADIYVATSEKAIAVSPLALVLAQVVGVVAVRRGGVGIDLQLRHDVGGREHIGVAIAIIGIDGALK
jgi:hypothetical protein